MSRLLHWKRTDKSGKSQKKKKRDPLVIRPRHDWTILFAMALIVNIIVVGVHVFMFYRITQGQMFVGEEATIGEISTINRSALSETLDNFREKENALVEAIATPPLAPSVR